MSHRAEEVVPPESPVKGDGFRERGDVRARAAGEPTIPSRIGLEKATNLFVRAADAEGLAALRLSRNGWRS